MENIKLAEAIHKKEMVSYSEYCEKRRSAFALMSSEAWHASAENRDILYATLMGAVEKYKNDDSIQFHESGIIEESDKIKAVLDAKG